MSERDRDRDRQAMLEISLLIRLGEGENKRQGRSEEISYLEDSEIQLRGHRISCSQRLGQTQLFSHLLHMKT